MVHLPVQENLHRDGILAVTEVPARGMPRRRAPGDRRGRARIAEALGLRRRAVRRVLRAGDGTLVVNEMAPRPHNSGHYSIDACDVSQFELQVRALPACRWSRRASTRRR